MQRNLRDPLETPLATLVAKPSQDKGVPNGDASTLEFGPLELTGEIGTPVEICKFIPVLLALREKPVIPYCAVQPVPADQLGAQQVYGFQGPQPKPK